VPTGSQGWRWVFVLGAVFGVRTTGRELAAITAAALGQPGTGAK
jgi:hypothetical protein